MLLESSRSFKNPPLLWRFNVPRHGDDWNDGICASSSGRGLNMGSSAFVRASDIVGRFSAGSSKNLRDGRYGSFSFSSKLPEGEAFI